MPSFLLVEGVNFIEMSLLELRGDYDHFYVPRIKHGT